MSNIEIKPNMKFYMIIDNEILEDIVGYVGEFAFVVEGFEDKLEEYNKFYYNEENKKWFRKLADAKRKLRERFPDRKIVLVDGFDDIWIAIERKSK